MRILGSHRIGIAQGTRLMFSDFADGGPMWAGTGPRESRHTVRFDQPFLEPPAMMVAISMWDLDRATNIRADLTAEAVTAAGFDLVFRTWADSRVARIRADWTAIGAVADEDHWDV